MKQEHVIENPALFLVFRLTVCVHMPQFLEFVHTHTVLYCLSLFVETLRERAQATEGK